MRWQELKEFGGRIVKGVNTTPDVGVNQIPIEAGKLGFKVDKDGRPPTLSKKVKGSKTNVLFNLGMAESVEERSLTKGEEKDKEKYVKGMKKNKKDFKKRYGDDAEAVMYATATKMAKESKLNELKGKELSSDSEIYVDMDGVLVDFFGEWTKMMGVKDWKQIKNVDAALQKIRDTEDFWLKLKPTPNADKLLGIIKDIKGEYNILSAPLANDDRAEPHKREWVKNNLSAFPPKKVIITTDKQAYAKQPDGTPNILIDDFGQNVSKWQSAGGVGFKHKDHKFERTASSLKDYFNKPAEENTNEILGFATRNVPRTTIKKKRAPEEPSVADKVKARRAAAARGDKDAYTHKFNKKTDEGELIPNPKNTSLVKSDADYDFIKLGTNMANIKDIDPNDMNPDDPDIMVQFYGGDKEKAYMLKQLKRLGYDVQDADGYKDAQYDEVISDDPNAYRLIINLIPENFADGKKKGKSRPGRVKKAGASCKGSVSSLRAKASKHGGEKGKMYHWCANMKGGKKGK
jgi:5'(3')-deoxyribonucleotidase